MYASVTSAKLLPGKLDEFLATYQKSVIPIAKEVPGLEHLYILTDANSNKGMSVALYETKADAERTQASGDYQKAIGLLMSTMDMGTLQREEYEVNIDV